MAHVRLQGCARGRNDNYDTAPENVTMVIEGELLAAAKSKGLHLWFSDLNDGNDSDQLFVNKGPVTLGGDGSFELPLGLNQMYGYLDRHSDSASGCSLAGALFCCGRCCDYDVTVM